MFHYNLCNSYCGVAKSLMPQRNIVIFICTNDSRKIWCKDFICYYDRRMSNVDNELFIKSKILRALFANEYNLSLSWLSNSLALVS